MGGGTRKRGGRGEGSRAKRFKKWGDKKDMQKVEAVIKKGLREWFETLNSFFTHWTLLDPHYFYF
jgi:hypothetical protein